MRIGKQDQAFTAVATSDATSVDLPPLTGSRC